MAKFLIQPECQIGANTFKIRWGDKMLDAAHVRGGGSFKEQIIRLHTGQSASATFEALIHEIDHMVSYTFGIEADSEELDVVARAAGMTQCLMSMGIEPDFSLIKEEKL